MKTAIAILAYNRPNILGTVLTALAPQVSNYDTFLFLDGPQVLNRSYYTEDDNKKLGDVCESLFTSYVPHGEVIRHPNNLNIAFNWKYAKEFMFSYYDRAIFFEDDLVPNHYYVEQLLHMMDETVDDERVGMISAYADHDHGVDFQNFHSLHYKEMGHQWGYGTWKDRYVKISTKLDAYYDIVSKSSYHTRDEEEIFTLFESWGNLNKEDKVASSQDAAVCLAGLSEGQVKISTNTNNAHYIGFVGEHFTLNEFLKTGMDKRVIYPHKELDHIWDDEIHDYIRYRLLSEYSTRYTWDDRKYLYD